MTRKFALAVAIILVLTAIVSIASDSGREKAAVTAAEKWVALLDSGNYANSWKEAAEYFKSAINQQQWEQSIKSVRNPLGKVIYRKVQSKTYQRTLPGAPDGEYVIIQFQTSFQNKKAAVETVTPMLDKDGQWRVSGYFIK